LKEGLKKSSKWRSANRTPLKRRKEKPRSRLEINDRTIFSVGGEIGKRGYLHITSMVGCSIVGRGHNINGKTTHWSPSLVDRADPWTYKGGHGGGGNLKVDSGKGAVLTERGVGINCEKADAKAVWGKKSYSPGNMGASLPKWGGWQKWYMSWAASAL